MFRMTLPLSRCWIFFKRTLELRQRQLKSFPDEEGTERIKSTNPNLICFIS
jgi:hypothetical protein